MRFSLLSLSLLCWFSLAFVFAQENSNATRPTCSHCGKSLALGWAQARPAAVGAVSDQYDVHFYHIDIASENTTTQIAGNLKASSTVIINPLDTFWFELNPALTIDSVKVNGSKRTASRNGLLVTVPLPAALPVGTALETQVFYRGNPTSSSYYADGLSTKASGSWKVNATWTLSQPFGSPDWLPAKQDLRDKIDSVWIFVTTTPPNKAAANGLLEHVTAMPGGKMRYEWKTRLPIDFYLIAYAVAPYVERSYKIQLPGQTDSMWFINYIYKGKNNQGDSCEAYFAADIDETVNMLEVFSERYGLYPFYAEKYGHMMAPFSGGMEHQTMTTQGLFNRDLTAHELGHQWFGDHVTCATWQDIWLNEGWATYSEYLYNESVSATDAADWLFWTQNDVIQNGATGSVYVPFGASSGRIFDGTLTYNKGGCVAHMLRYLLGDSAFFATLQSYQQSFAFSTATTDDFRDYLIAQTGVPMTDFFNEWVYGEGYASYDAEWNQVGNYLYFRVLQTPSAPGTTPYFSIPVPIELTIGGKKQEFRIIPDGNIQWFEIKGTATTASLDPQSWLLKGNSTLIKNSGLTANAALLPAQSQKVWSTGNGAISVEPLVQESIVFSLYDMAGRQIKTATVAETTPFGNLPAGIYQWKASVNGKTATGRVMVQ